MEESFPFKFALIDFGFSMVSLQLFIVDIVLDLWAVLSLYEEQKYLSMGLLIFLLFSSSVIQQIFSWLWYSDTSKELVSKIEKFIDGHRLMALVHIFQLGVFLRFAGLMELSISSFKQNDLLQSGVAVYMKHELNMLRLFEAFTKSAPHLVLMMAPIMETQERQFFDVIKFISSFYNLIFTVVSYHHSMRSFVSEKLKLGWSSSIIYFLWNLTLIGTRVVCVSLVASVLPCLIAAHFLSLWTLLVIWAWWQKTDFMDIKAGEWLYRATVGLIWYFNRFNVTSGKTKLRGIIYHMVMGADNMLLLGLWWWWRSVESARLSPFPIHPYLLIGLLMIIYITGVLMKHILILKDEESEMKTECDAKCYDSLEVDMSETPEPILEPEGTVLAGIHRRMRHMAVNFYC